MGVLITKLNFLVERNGIWSKQQIMKGAKNFMYVMQHTFFE